jgi:hypothetical protein
MSTRITLDWHGDRIEAAWRDRGSAGVQEAAEHLRDSAAELAPRDIGNLRESGAVQRDGLEGSVSFGGPPSEGVIAIVQHERLDFNHTMGGPKYLEKAMLLEASVMLRIIGTKLR